MPTSEPAMSPSDLPVAEVLDRATGPRRAEVDELLQMHREISGEEPVVWAGRILGFGQVDYATDSGRTGSHRCSRSPREPRSTRCTS